MDASDSGGNMGAISDDDLINLFNYSDSKAALTGFEQPRTVSIQKRLQTNIELPFIDFTLTLSSLSFCLSNSIPPFLVNYLFFLFLFNSSSFFSISHTYYFFIHCFLLLILLRKSSVYIYCIYILIYCILYMPNILPIYYTVHI